MTALDDGEAVGKLEPVFVRKSRTGKCRGFSVVGEIYQRDGRTRSVRLVKLEIAPPLKPELIDHRAGDCRIPVRDEKSLVRAAFAVLRCAAVGHGGLGVVTVRLTPVLPVEDRIQMVGRV